MSTDLGGSSGLMEKLEHSLVVDLLSLGVYAYFGYVSYQNFEYGQNVSEVSGDPNVLAVQLAGFLIILNVLFMLHDKVS